MVAERASWLAQRAAEASSTDPADRDRVEQGLRRLYARMGLAPPERIVWVASPLVAAIAGPIAATIHGGPRPTRDWRDQDAWSAIDAHTAATDSAFGSTDPPGRAPVADPAAIEATLDPAHRWPTVHRTVTSALRPLLADPLHDDRFDRAWTELREPLRAAVRDAIAGVARPVGAVLRDAGASVHRTAIRDGWARGRMHAHDPWWAARLGALPLPDAVWDLVEAWIDAGSAGWWWPHERFVVVSGRPTALHLDPEGRPHCEDGAAITWADGWSVWAWHGVPVPADGIDGPPDLAAIARETDRAVHRAWIDRFGGARYAVLAGATEVARDDWGRLLRHETPFGEVVLVVEVEDATPSPDGTRKRYHLRVHPHLCPLLPDGELGDPQAPTPLNAIASLHGLRGEEYRTVLVET